MELILNRGVCDIITVIYATETEIHSLCGAVKCKRLNTSKAKPGLVREFDKIRTVAVALLFVRMSRVVAAMRLLQTLAGIF